MDTEPDDLPLIRCAVYTRQSVVRAGEDPALASCAVQRTLCTEFIRSMAWRGWYRRATDAESCGHHAAAVAPAPRNTAGPSTRRILALGSVLKSWSPETKVKR